MGERHPVFAFPPDVRRVIYTTNVIESLHMQLRKIIKNRGHFPNDDAAVKLIWFALRNITDGKVRSAREWTLAMNQFAVLYGDRFVSHAMQPASNTENLIRPIYALILEFATDRLQLRVSRPSVGHNATT